MIGRAATGDRRNFSLGLRRGDAAGGSLSHLRLNGPADRSLDSPADRSPDSLADKARDSQLDKLQDSLADKLRSNLVRREPISTVDLLD